MAKLINEIFVFDIDGVLNNIETHKLEEKQLLGFLIKILERGEPIALNTGRPLSWVEEQILTTIENEINEKKLLSNFFIVAEKGGSWIDFNSEGQKQTHIDENINIPDVIKNKLREMVKEKFKDKVFYDETKQTMVTLQKEDRLSLEDFNSFHSSLNEEIDKILKEYDPKQNYKYVPTTLDTDIESILVGKDFGMKRILSWLKQKDVEAKKFITFGDSKPDLDMAKHLYENGHKVEFVFVGTTKIGKQDFPIIIPSAKFDKGTLEYLRSN